MKSLLAHDENLEKVFKKSYILNSNFIEGDVSIVRTIYEMLKFELEDENQNEVDDNKKQNDENDK